jgi:hypothetical protein
MNKKMNKKILIFGILAVFLMMTVSIVSVVGSEITTETKESPLWRIRTRQAIREKIGRIMENIHASFLGENRVFFVPSLYRIIQSNELFNGPPTFVTCSFLTACK